MRTLRVAFLSGAVLELAATLGIALVAVTVGVRLVEGGIGYEAGAHGALACSGALPPLRALAAQYHASADGVAVAERLLELTGESESVSRASAQAIAPAGDSIVRLEDVSYAYPARPGSCSKRSTSSCGRTRPLRSSAPVGAGKSTLASIVLGLVEPTGGRVLRAGET